MQAQPNSSEDGSSGEVFDFIIVGGGIGGTAVASRLYERDPSLSILLIEADPDSSKTPLAEAVASPVKAPLLKRSELDWSYETVPQKHLDGLKVYVGAGKAMRGGSVINYGLWTRGDSKDYDTWTEIVGDDRWSWSCFLPYFSKTEHHFSPVSKSHGYNGPVHTASVSSSGRNYSLREPLKEALAALGIQQAADINGGSPLGLAEIVEARTGGQRVVASSAYSMTGITVLTSTLVRRILVSNLPDGTKVAMGVELSSGQKYTARAEVILSAGTIKTPQLLMLSGIGPAEELQHHGIQQLVDSPEVGRNLWDHLGLTQQWKLRSPELGAAFGSPAFNDPKFMNGNAMDWHTTSSVPTTQLKAALAKDLDNESTSSGVGNHELVRGGGMCHMGLLVFYVGVPLDGSLITTCSLNYLPTSRGTVTLASPDIETKSLIDHNHYATHADRYRLRTAVRTFSKLTSTPPLAEIISGEAIHPGCKGTSEDSTDEEIDERVKKGAMTIQHHAGTASMEKAVDSELKVKGVKGLRVVDASIIPAPISCPIQTVLYVLAERAVDLILGEDSV